MMDDFTRNYRNTERYWRPHDFKNISLPLGLTLANNRVSMTVEESVNLIIKIMDLLFGPLNFCQTFI